MQLYIAESSDMRRVAKLRTSFHDVEKLIRIQLEERIFGVVVAELRHFTDHYETHCDQNDRRNEQQQEEPENTRVVRSEWSIYCIRK